MTEVVVVFIALVKQNQDHHRFLPILSDKVTWKHPGDLEMLLSVGFIFLQMLQAFRLLRPDGRPHEDRKHTRFALRETPALRTAANSHQIRHRMDGVAGA